MTKPSVCICGHNWKNHHKQKWREFNVPCGICNRIRVGDGYAYNCWTFEWADESRETTYITNKNGRTVLKK